MGEGSVARDDGPAQRLFLAVEVPRSARDVVGEAIEPWRKAYAEARWVPPENWHVTLKFLGWTPARLVPWVEKTAGGVVVGRPPATARVRGLGAFPSPRRARVLWAGIDDPGSGLSDLATALEAALAEGTRTEMRRFHPHLTIARSEPPLRLPDAYADTPLASKTFVADRVVLFRSHTHGRSTTYEALRTFALTG